MLFTPEVNEILSFVVSQSVLDKAQTVGDKGQ